MTKAEKVALLVELPGGEVIAVAFGSREHADRWAAGHNLETVGRPQLASSRSLTVGHRLRDRTALTDQSSRTHTKDGAL